ncbi:MAG: hypothetical protein ACKO3W_10215 [bacterium]
MSTASALKAAASLSELSTEVLARELARRRAELPKLERRSAELRRELADVEARMAALGAAIGSGHKDRRDVASTSSRLGSRTAGRSGTSKPARQPNAPRRERKGAPTLGARLLAYLAAHPGIHPPGALAETIAAETGRECSQSFIVSTNAALRKLIVDGVVEKVGRGQYRAKGSPDAAAK